MELTPEGERAAFAASDILSRIDHLCLMFSERKSLDVVLDLAVSVNLFAGMPTGVDELFLEHSDSLRFLELGCDECYQRVCSGEVDAAVVMCMERSFTECDMIEIGRSTSYAIANEKSELAKKGSIDASDFRGRTLLVMSDIGFQYAPLLAQLNAFGLGSPATSIMPSTSSMIHLVRTRQEDMVGIVSKRFAMTPPGGTVSVPLGDSRLDWHFYVLYRVDASKKASVMKFVRDVKAAFAAGEARWREEEEALRSK